MKEEKKVEEKKVIVLTPNGFNCNTSTGGWK